MTMPSLGDVAPIQRRVIAYVIDAAIGFAVAVLVPTIVLIAVAMSSRDLLGPLLVAGPLFAVLGLAWAVVYTVMQAGSGSIGMRAQGIRLVSAAGGGRLGFGRALLRNVIWGLAASIVVGYFTVLFDGSGRFQGWHDRVAGAIMTDARAPYRAAAPGWETGAGRPAVPGAPVPGASSPAAPVQQSPVPQTSMPGFARPGGAFASPSTPAPAPPPATPAMTAPPAPLVDESAERTVQVSPSPGVDESSEHTVLAPPVRRELPEDPLISFVPGVTQEPEPSAGPVPPAESEPAPTVGSADPAGPAGSPAPTAPVEQVEPALMDDDDDIESTRISVPGHRLVFTWDDGQRATVSGRTVFGRNPDEQAGAIRVAVRDETRSLSKTHFEAGADAQGGWVMDRRSTNGTTLVRDGVRMTCPPGQRVPVRLGDALEIGDRIVTIGGWV